MADALETIAAQEAERNANYGDQPDAARTAFLAVVDQVVDALSDAPFDWLFVGGIASSILGRPRVTHDVDLMVRPEDARTTLALFAASGFDIEERAPHWLFKAYRDDHEVDVIFRSSGDVYLDEPMAAHAVIGEFHGRPLRILGPEDLAVMKALAHQEHSPRHWFDALAVLSANQIDWPYLIQRASHGRRRVLSLLYYAQSSDLAVPAWVVDELSAP